MTVDAVTAAMVIAVVTLAENAYETVVELLGVWVQMVLLVSVMVDFG